MLQRSMGSETMMDTVSEPASGSAGSGETMYRIVSMLRRRWKVFAAVTVTALILGLILLMMIPQKFESTARVQIDPARSPSSASQVIASLESEAIETEVTVMNGEDLAREVVRKLGLLNDPEFNKSEEPAVSAYEKQKLLTAVTRRVQSNLNVRRDRLTYVIDIGFKSKDPLKSAKIANAFAETYIDSRLGSRAGTAERQSKFYQQQLADLGSQVRAADAAVAQYRARTGITQGVGSNTIADQQVGPLSSELATAEAAAAEARSNLAVARQQISRGGMDAVSEVRNSTVVADLRRQRAEVMRNMGEVDARYGARHPESIKVHNQLAALDAQIEAEARRAVGTLEAAARAADARAGSLRGELGQLQGKQASNTRASVEAESLERDAQSKRTAYDRLAGMALETSQGARNPIAQAAIVDEAIPPTTATSPNRKLLAIVIGVVALALGMGTITVQELLVPGIRDSGFFEARYGIPLLAAVPDTRKGPSAADIVADRPTSAVSETLRIAHGSVFGARNRDNAPKVLALTSALPAEGKTTTSLAFARMMAGKGDRTLIIDCDIRHATLAETAGTKPRDVGLVELLAGQGRLSDAIIADRVAGLDLLPVTARTYTAENVFGGDRLSDLLAQLAPAYDHILLDLPPVVGLADARIIAPLADAVILITRWGRTPASAIDAAMYALRSEEANVVGAIFTRVDQHAEAAGGLYYSKKYSSYYQPS